MITTIELFAGAGGMALGLEKAGFQNIALNEFDKDSCNTLRINRPNWNIIHNDISNVSWENYFNKVDMIAGGFPCQSFSYSGKRLGLEDTRGTLFYEFARTIKETSPLCFLAENVKGLLNHDNGKTLDIILNTFENLGYYVFKPLLVNSNYYNVAQKRERLLIFGVKKTYKNFFSFNDIPKHEPISLKDIFFPGKYYESIISENIGTLYSEKKKKYFELIPEGGNWKNLPEALQKEYMGKMFYSGGGKTGVLKRLSLNEPSVTILTSPSQKQTERCHPIETRPLNIRESARIQSFPDEWMFSGSISSQYRQIGNAVPVNLAFHVGEYLFSQINNFKYKT